jgi:hypothetical protein
MVGLLLSTVVWAEPLKQFSYCGEIRIELPLPMAGAGMPQTWLGAMGPTPAPPRSCAYVRLGQAKDGQYRPMIVVWSDGDFPMPYHADIYSDQKGIWGRRNAGMPGMEGAAPDDPAAIRDMELFLDAAAGSPVLQTVLRALRAGRHEASLDRRVHIGDGAPVAAHYRLFDFRANARFPERVERLIHEARAHRHPHDRSWKGIVVPASPAHRRSGREKRH